MESILTIKCSAMCLSLLIGTADIVLAADNDLTLAVAVDKVVYQPGGKGEATVRIESSPAHSSKRVVRLRMTVRLMVSDNSSPKKVCRLTGPFGEQFLTCDQFEKPGVYQSFTYEYHSKDGRSDAIALFYHGETDLYMDSVVVEQLTFTQDRDLFSKKQLRFDSLPDRKGTSRKAHLARGLWHDYFGLDDALKRADIESTEA